MEITENYLDVTKKTMFEKSVYIEQNINLQLNFTIEVSCLIFLL